jgi:hypothetical protein
MTIKYGLEKEYWLMKGQKVQVIPVGLPHDSCGYLLEARGQPYPDITDAVYSLKADEDRLYRMVQYGDKIPADCTISESPYKTLTADTILKATRYYAKGLTSYQNYLGHAGHAVKSTQGTAGVHITVSNEYTFTNSTGGKQMVNLNFDWLRLFQHLDRFFALEIREAKRLPGFYELKGNGLIEYRSLPANVDLNKVITAIRQYEYSLDNERS